MFMRNPYGFDMDAPIELRHLNYFVAVAEELHFSRAARRLGIEQPPLSQQIRRLERLLGCALFERKPRVALTEAGRTLLGVARRTLAQVAQGVEETRQAGRGETGTLSIGFAASAVLTRLPDVIHRYRERFPRVAVRLRELSPAAELNATGDGLIDVGFVRERSADERLVYETWIREPFVVLLPPAHPLAAKKSLLPEALAEYPFVHFARDVAPSLYDQVMQICWNAGFVPRVVQEVREWLTHISLVGAGLGLSLVPASFRRLRWGSVTYRPLRRCSSEASIALCYRLEELCPTVKAFTDLARAVMGGPAAGG
jgi:DNA-binding transcriptional LysR family regulator